MSNAPTHTLLLMHQCKGSHAHSQQKSHSKQCVRKEIFEEDMLPVAMEHSWRKKKSYAHKDMHLHMMRCQSYGKWSNRTSVNAKTCAHTDVR